MECTNEENNEQLSSFDSKSTLDCITRKPKQLFNPRFCVTPENIGLEINHPKFCKNAKSVAVSTNNSEIPYDNQMVSIQNEGQKKQGNLLQSNVDIGNQRLPVCDKITEHIQEIKSKNSRMDCKYSCEPNTSEISQHISSVFFDKSVKSFIPSVSNTIRTLQFPKKLHSDSVLKFSMCGNQPCLPIISDNPKTIKKISSENYRQQIEKFDLQSELYPNNTMDISNHLNKIFLKRLIDIDEIAEGNTDLKLLTYQEWTQMLLKINESITINMEEFESEVTKQLELIHEKKKSNCDQYSKNELEKYRKDINTLIKIIRNAYHRDYWNFQGLSLETISTSEILGLYNDADQYLQVGEIQTEKQINNSKLKQGNKLFMNIKVLAFEVAHKHDEIRALKKQINIIECEIYDAQKKIQLKDDLIQDLRNDLKCANTKRLEVNSFEASVNMPPINLENQETTRSINNQLSDSIPLMLNDDFSNFETLAHNEHVEQQKLKLLEDELTEFFEINKEFNKHNIEMHRKRLSDIFKKLETEKTEAYRKLDCIRGRLFDLEASSTDGSNDCDSGFGSKCEDERDFKILDTVRKRIRKLSNTILDLKKQMQKLDVKNYELTTRLNVEKTRSERSGRALKEIADLLCRLMNQQFSYTDIYNPECNTNPFCEVILQIKNQYQKSESQLLHTAAIRNKKIGELTNDLLENEKNYNEQRGNHMNESLKCEIEHMQRIIVEREKRILQLNAMLAQSTQMHSHNAVEDKFFSSEKMCEMEKKILHLSNELNKSQKEENFLHSETRKLNEDLNESRRKNGDLIVQSKRLASLLKKQETHRMDLAEKFEVLESSFEDQSKQLREANIQLCILNERFVNMEKRQCEHNIERNLLREEVLALKEKEAALLGTLKNIQDQILKAEEELYKAHDVIKEQQCITQHTELAHKEAIKRLQEINNETKRKFSTIFGDYKRLQEEYEKMKDSCENKKILESLRKCNAQNQAEDKTLERFTQYENGNRLLLKDKQRYIEQYRKSYYDYNNIENELDYLKICPITMATYNQVQHSPEGSVGECLEVIRQTTSRLSKQCSSFEDVDFMNYESNEEPL